MGALSKDPTVWVTEASPPTPVSRAPLDGSCTHTTQHAHQ